MPDTCPFCSIPENNILLQNEFAFAIPDGFPVSPGHKLIIPKRHVASFFDLTPAERTAVFDLVVQAKAQIQNDTNPAGFNIGINDGEAAGQTIHHLHIHLIPRYDGDTPDPRGGVRWIFPDKAVYWED